MKVTVNPKGVEVNQFLMKAALPLGGYFIFEYIIRNLSASHMLLGLLNIPMMIVTVVLVYFIIKTMRNKCLDGYIAGFYAWTFGVQLMFFAGLIEAAFIYIFNEFLFPTNLVTVRDQLLVQYEDVLASVKSLSNGSEFVGSMSSMMEETIEALKKTPVASAIETAITMLSNDIFYGMIMMLFIAPIIKKHRQENDQSSSN